MKRTIRRFVSLSTPVPVAAGALLVTSAGRARSGEASDLESQVFRLVNRAPEALRVPVWLVMQSGSLAAVFVTGAALARTGRTRSAAVATLAGTAVWGGIKLFKPLIGRGRPAEVLRDVRVRGLSQSGLGYPSGHAAVATTLTAVLVPGAPVAGQMAAAAYGGIVGGTRMYVGAHLPLDVVGGIAVGLLGGQAAREILDRMT